MLPIHSLAPTLPLQTAKFIRDTDAKLLEVNPMPSRLPSLKVGEEVTARVVNPLADNRLVVMIKQDLLTLNINARGAQNLSAEPGSTMKLKVASLEPRLTFLMSSEPNKAPVDRNLSRVTLSGATRYLSALLNNQSVQNSRLMPALSQQFPSISNQNNDVHRSLSPFLSAALDRMARPSMAERMGLEIARPKTAEQASRLARPWVMNSTALLTPQTTATNSTANTQLPSTQLIAGQLRNLVASSGLFYESHIKQWFQGERPLSELLQQPQAKTELPRAVLSLLNQQGTPINEEQLASKLAESKLPAQKEGGAQTSAAGLGQIVSKQLDVLEFRQVALQGQLMPNQPFLMQIQEVPDPHETQEREGDGKETHHKYWKTRLVLDMPLLGGVEARLNITPDGIQVHLMTEEARAAQLAEQYQAHLYQSMRNAGLSLNQLDIEGEIHD